MIGLSTMVFDIETIPDIDGARVVLGLGNDVDEETVHQAIVGRQLEKTEGRSDFLPHYLHRIVSIAVLLTNPQGVKVWSLGEESDDEKTLITRFFEGIKRYNPVLVSWNGKGFDCPVLHYRALRHGVVAETYWDNGRLDSQTKWNNYLGRYHEKHLDLMDVLANYQARANAPLSEMAMLLGWPGKLGESGGQVYDKYRAGQLAAIRDYCETDVVNTYGVYLAFQAMRGILTPDALRQEKKRLQAHLSRKPGTHWAPFIEVLTRDDTNS